MASIVLVIFGLAIGSFLNVLILRYDPEKKFTLKTAGGRSRCLHCTKTLRWYELVPVVSWIVQLGKCRHCKKKISIQYPVVELASAALFVFIPQIIFNFLRFNGGFFQADPWYAYPLSAVWILISLFLLAAFFIDVRHYIIPNLLNLAIFIGGVAWVVAGQLLSFGEFFSRGSLLGSYGDLFTISGAEGFWNSFLFNHIFGMIVGAGFFLLVIFITRGRGMGMGDAKLMAGLGLLFGYPDVVLLMMFSFLFGTIYAVPFLILGKKRMKDMLPFGPFIVLASLAVFFFGARVLEGYFGIIESIGF